MTHCTGIPRQFRTAGLLPVIVLTVACSAGPEPETAPPPRPSVEEADTLPSPEPRRPEARRPEPRRVEPRRVEPPEKEPEKTESDAPAGPEVEDAIEGAPPLSGWSRGAEAILPRRRIVAFYGNPRSRNMGILGELPAEEMLVRLDREVADWERADPNTPVTPALHLIAVMATADPGSDSLYRLRQPDAVIEQVLDWAESRKAIVFLDIQPGRSSVAAELPRLEKWLQRPDIHLALDPEWAVPAPRRPGQVIGAMTAADVNAAVRFLARIVQERQLPPKILVVHRFTQGMLRNPEDIGADPRVQVVLNMDGWGPPEGKRASYRNFVAPAPVPLKGFKLFYRNDRRGGSRLMTPEEVLSLRPVPIYIQYQ